MKINKILKAFDWEDVFENSSQLENLNDFLEGTVDYKEFVEGFYPKSKNKRLAKLLKDGQWASFKKHAKKLFNMSNVGCWRCVEEENRQEYLSKL